MTELKTVAVAACSLAAVSFADASVIEVTFPLSISQSEEEGGGRVIDLTGVPFPGFEPTGVGTITLDTDTNELEWTIFYAGLTGSTIGAHIHSGAPGDTGGVLVPLSAGGDPATGVLASIAPVVVSDVTETAILSGDTYINIHTVLNGAGEIRGQILAVPEPASAVLAGVGTLMLLGRRRK